MEAGGIHPTGVIPAKAGMHASFHRRYADRILANSAGCRGEMQKRASAWPTLSQASVTSSWKVLPPSVGLTMPARITKSPKRSPSSRSLA
jgi:hypothetical protein